MPIMDQVVEDTRFRSRRNSFRSIEPLWFERGVREADGSIKPGAQAPGSNAKNVGRAFLFYRSWGLRPRLYAAVRFADSASYSLKSRPRTNARES